MNRLALIIIPIAIVLVSLQIHTAAAGNSALETLAQSMQPGTWALLTTNNLNATFTANGSSRNSVAEGPEMVWDPISQQVFFFGSDHCDTSQFISYSVVTNTWQRLPRGPWMPTVSDYCNGMMHGYDHSAVDQVRGIFYHRPFSAKEIERYDSSTGNWTRVPMTTGDYVDCCIGVEYFPELDSVVVVNGGGGVASYNNVYLYKEGTQQWSTIAINQSGTAGDTHRNFARYNPVHKVVVFTIRGFGDRRLFKLDRFGQVTQLRDAPVGLGIMSPGDNDGVGSCIFVVDPISGDYLVITRDKEFYRYDVVNDVWQRLSISIPPAVFTTSYDVPTVPGPNAIFAVSVATINTYGVNMFVSCDLSNCRVHLYKHSTGTVPAPPSDTTPPSVTISSPASGASVSGTVSVAANASDNVGVLGVQFKLDGNNLGAEDTTSPYSVVWDTTTVSTGSHTLTAVARDAAGNVSTSTGISVTVSNSTPPTTPPPTGSLTFAQKCAQSGVINCFDFDSPSVFKYTWPTGTVCDAIFAGQTNYNFGLDRRVPGNAAAKVQNGQCMYPEIDSAAPHSGSGSMKFTIPSNSDANSSGYFTEPYKRNSDGTFPYIGPGSPLGNVLYFQFYQKFDAPFLTTNFQCLNGGCGGWKQAIWYGNPPLGSSSSTIEVTMNNGWQRNVPQMYGQQGHDAYGIEDAMGCTYAKATSQGGSGSGYDSRPNYAAPLNPTCAHYDADQWMEFTGRIEIRGASDAPASRVQLWVNGQMVIDYGAAKINWGGADGDGLGEFLLSPYHTNKDPNQTHAVGHTWYDDVIISTQPISMVTGGSTPPPPPTDTIPPTVSISAPTNGTTVSGISVSVSATASDNIGVAGVQFRLDGVNLGAEDTTSPYSVIWNTTTAPNGTHTLTAIARDAVGNQTTSGSVSVTVNNSALPPPPTGTTTLIDFGATSALNIFGLAGWNTPIKDDYTDYQPIGPGGTTIVVGNNYTYNFQGVTGSARNFVFGEKIVVTWYNNSASSIVFTPNISFTDPDRIVMGVTGTWYPMTQVTVPAFGVATSEYVLTSSTAGSYSLVNVNGNYPNNSVLICDKIELGSGTTPPSDTTAPTVSITVPASAATVSGPVTISAVASDNVGVVGVQFGLDGANWGSEDTSSPYSISWDTTSATNGQHTIAAIARDAAGNQTTSAAVSVTVNNVSADTTAPSVSLTGPSNGATVSGSNVTVAATASDNVAVVGVQFKLDGVNLGAEDATSPYSIVWDTGQTSNGSHTLTAVARDAAGNQTTSGPVTLTVNNSDVTAPSVSMIAPSASATVLGSSVMVSASATDNVGVAGVQFQLDGTALGAEDTVPPFSIMWNTTQASNGNHMLKAVARDAAGNQTTSAGIAVTVNNDSTPPVVAMTAPLADSTVYGSNVSVSASALDNVGVVGVQFKLDGQSLGAEILASPWLLIWNSTQAANGLHTLSAVARDAAGNQTTSAGITVTVNNGNDTIAPVVAITSPQPDLSLSAFVTLSASASDNKGVVGVQFAVDGINIGPEVQSGPYRIVWDTTKTVNGTHIVKATARDGANNQSSVEETVSVSNVLGGGVTYKIPKRGGGSWKWNPYPIGTQALSADDAMTIGYLRILTDSGNTAPAGTAVIGFWNNGMLVSEAGVPATVPMDSGVMAAELNGPVTTGVAIANANNQESSIRFTLYNSDGFAVRTGSFVLGPNRQMSALLNQPPFAAPEGFQGTLAYTASTRVSVIALRGFTNERSEFLMTTLPVAPLRSDTVAASAVLPFFADGGGWTTQVILENPGDTPLAGMIQFFGPGSGSSALPLNLMINGKMGSSFSYNLPPFGSTRLVTSSTSSNIQVGSVRLTSAGSQGTVPQSLAIFSYHSFGTTVSEASVPLAAAGRAFQTFVEYSVTDQIRSGLSVTNPSASPVTVDLDLTTLDGQSAGLFGSIQLPPDGQISKFLDELFPSLPPGFQGLLRLTAPSPVSVIGLRGRLNPRGDFLITTMPFANDDTVVVTPFETIFPHVVSGGNYTTQFILFSSGPDGTASGTMQLMGRDGTPLPFQQPQ